MMSISTTILCLENCGGFLCLDVRQDAAIIRHFHMNVVLALLLGRLRQLLLLRLTTLASMLDPSNNVAMVKLLRRAKYLNNHAESDDRSQMDCHDSR